MRFIWVEYRYRPETVKMLKAEVAALPDDAPRWNKWCPRSPVVFEEVCVNEHLYGHAKASPENYLFRETYNKAQYADHVYVHYDDGTVMAWKHPDIEHGHTWLKPPYYEE